jgi:hypothetical protein
VEAMRGLRSLPLLGPGSPPAKTEKQPHAQ